ncbi:tol-pal system-associated acyl-CoA thioesterase [Simiduia sp. 21SJ11W-1]|uniref:tol-pal system-associated acyl-CoA thioesterase n=1 Tax=Simiduia sp. 21SJ11W-1 TaxID=2909669 RepID=UPI0020A10166|nr:tol-pal system-associated acyl-CoA thioesterase [Simiduia sp. 21SJ11W-1]UTA49102.1 tol-pal system-associated acyl-CoA thioesterase [Simiduia sp. 21SJ11W-1]
MTDCPPFSTAVRVYIEDTDAGGIVYYVNYLKFMERARTEFMRALGYDKPAFLSGDRLLVVHSANTRYLKPARLDDHLQVSAEVSRLARSYLVFRQCVKRADELLCEAEIKVACVRQSDMRPVPLPEDVQRALAAKT